MRLAERVAAGLIKHDGVLAAEANGDLVLVRRPGLPVVTVRVVDAPHLEETDLPGISVHGVDAIVLPWRATYSWAAKEAAQSAGADLFNVTEFWGALNARRLAAYELNCVEYFIDRIESHDRVARLVRRGFQLFDVERLHRSTLRMYCADEYLLSEVFVQDVMGRHPGVQVITNLSAWNSYSDEAQSEALRLGARICDLSETYRALNLEPERFIG